MSTTTDSTGQPSARPQDALVYRVHIKASQERVWEAITSPEWNARYGYGTAGEFELRVGGAYRVRASEDMVAFDPNAPEIIIDGEILECDPPNKLVQTYRTLWDEEAKAEGFHQLSYELKPLGEVTRLTVVHEVKGAPRTAGLLNGDIEPFGGGWPQILSDLKSLLETGSSMYGEQTA